MRVVSLFHMATRRGGGKCNFCWQRIKKWHQGHSSWGTDPSFTGLGKVMNAKRLSDHVTVSWDWQPAVSSLWGSPNSRMAMRCGVAQMESLDHSSSRKQWRQGKQWTRHQPRAEQTFCQFAKTSWGELPPQFKCSAIWIIFKGDYSRCSAVFDGVTGVKGLWTSIWHNVSPNDKELVFMRVDRIVIGSHEWESSEYVYIKILDNESVNCEGSLMADQRDNGVLATMDMGLHSNLAAATTGVYIALLGGSQLLETTVESCSNKLSLKLMSFKYLYSAYFSVRTSHTQSQKWWAFIVCPSYLYYNWRNHHQL